MKKFPNFIQHGSLIEGFIIDAESLRFLHATDAALERLGYDLDTLRQHSLAALIPDTSLAELRDFLGQVHANPLVSSLVLACRLTASDGRVRPMTLEVRLSEQDGRQVYACGGVVARDSQQDLEQLRLAIMGANLGYWDFNDDTGTYFVDDTWLAMLGLEREALDSRDPTSWYRYIHPDDRDTVLASVGEEQRAGKSFRSQFRMLHRDGHLVWIESAGAIVEWDYVNDRPRRISGTHRDITQEKQTETALKYQEAMYQALAANTEDLIFHYDRDYRCLYVNPTVEKELGHREFVGRTLEEMDYPDEVKKIWKEAFDRVFATGEKQHAFLDMERPDRRVNIHWYAYPGLRGAEGRVETIFAVSHNVTELRQAEDELHRMQRLKSLGVLAGGIAHDFNNILTVLFGNITMAKDQLESANASQAGLDSLANAEKAFNRASRLTGQLLTFAKGGEPIKQHLDLREVVEEGVTFGLSGSNVKLAFECENGLWMADADKGQIGQVFSNLALNANQAMPGGGMLFIRLENALIADGEIPGLKAGRYVRVTVRDQGSGIPQQALNRIFDPYYSTREGGSGLGLATAYSIIDKHEGHIGVRSTLGLGTTFQVNLPAAENPVSWELVEKPVTVSEGQSRKILVMDDEEMICQLATSILARDNYQVDIARDGREALSLYRQALEECRRYDCVIMDLTIPGGMGGKEAIGEVLAMDPDARVIVASGYAVDPVMANFDSYGFKGVITKPFRLDDLRNEVARLLQ